MSTHWTSAGFLDDFGPWLWMYPQSSNRRTGNFCIWNSKKACFGASDSPIKANENQSQISSIYNSDGIFNAWSDVGLQLSTKLGLRNGMKTYCELGGEVTDKHGRELFGCEIAHRWQRLVVIVQVIVGSEDDWEQRFGQDVRGSLLAQKLNKLGLGVCKVLQLLVERDSPHLHRHTDRHHPHLTQLTASQHRQKADHDNTDQ